MSDAPEARPPWKGRRIVLGVTGGIAAYKSVLLARRLTQLGAEVDVVMTEAAGRFVGALTFEGVTGRAVLTDLFSVEGAARHISLGRDADLVCVAPATADFLARAAMGRADDLLTTTLLATRAPVLVCPAMNDAMWAHPQVRANAEHLADVLGYHLAGPAEGPLAVGEASGPGRMLEPEEIIDHIGLLLTPGAALRGKTVLVTAGPTQEPLDPVRYIGNRSSGRMGYAIAASAWRRGAKVKLVSGPVNLPTPTGVERISVETAIQMKEAVDRHLADADVLIFAAAVADFRPSDPKNRKVKRGRDGDELTVELEANPDIAAGSQNQRWPGAVAVGFALETENMVENAKGKLERKGLDLIVANPADEPDAGFGVDTNRVTLVDRSGTEELPLLHKDEVADVILERVERILDSRS